MQALSRVSSRTSEASVASSASSSVVSTTSSDSAVYIPLHKRSGSSSSHTTASSTSSKNTDTAYSNPTGRYTIHELLNISCSPLTRAVTKELRGSLMENAPEILVKRTDADMNRKRRKYMEFTTKKHLGELIKEARQEQKEKKKGDQPKQTPKRQYQRQGNTQPTHTPHHSKSRSQPLSQVSSPPQPQPRSQSQSASGSDSQWQTVSRGFGQRRGTPQPLEYRPYFQTVKPYNLDATLSHSTSLQTVVAH